MMKTKRPSLESLLSIAEPARTATSKDRFDRAIEIRQKGERMRRIIASTGLAFFVALAGAGLTTTAGATARGAAATGAPKQQAAPAAPDITVSPGESIQSA